MKIGIDLDGPLYPFEYCLWDWCVSQGHRSGPLPKTTTWNFFEEPGWDGDLDWYKQMAAEAAAAGHLFYSQEPHAGAVEGMSKLRELGHTLHIMTYRMFPGAVNNTDRWLSKYNVPFDSLSFTKDKTIIPVHMMIEDNVENAKALQAAGVIPVIVDRAWNQEWNGTRIGDCNDPEANEWEEFVAMVNFVAQWEFKSAS